MAIFLRVLIVYSQHTIATLQRNFYVATAASWNVLPLYGITFGPIIQGIPHVSPLYKFPRPSMENLLSTIASPSSDWHQILPNIYRS